MSPPPTSPATASPGSHSPAITPSPQINPAPTSPTTINDAALKSTNAGVKKPAQKKTKKAGSKTSRKAKVALQKMLDFFKAHRGDDEYKDMTHPERQKALGALWKVSPENPKNSIQA